MTAATDPAYGIGNAAGLAPAGQPTPQRFYDSAEWPELPPPPRWGMLYRDGRFAAFQQPHQFARYRWITVTGDYRHAGAADWLPDNRFDLAEYVDGRRQMGVRARVYVARSKARAALDALGYPRAGHLWTYPGLYYWIPTLDGRPGWTPQSITADLATNWDAPIPAGRIWAIQWGQEPELGAGAAYDVSNLFGEW
jgi:hypothetical protein